jgi:hypothetical protein
MAPIAAVGRHHQAVATPGTIDRAVGDPLQLAPRHLRQLLSLISELVRPP